MRYPRPRQSTASRVLYHDHDHDHRSPPCRHASFSPPFDATSYPAGRWSPPRTCRSPRRRRCRCRPARRWREPRYWSGKRRAGSLAAGAYGRLRHGGILLGRCHPIGRSKQCSCCCCCCCSARSACRGRRSETRTKPCRPHHLEHTTARAKTQKIQKTGTRQPVLERRSQRSRRWHQPRCTTTQRARKTRDST